MRSRVIKSDVFLCDTNYIIRYLIQEEPELYRHANAFFEEIYEGSSQTQVLESVIVECVYVLDKYYAVPKEEIVQTLVGLLQYKGVVNSDKHDLINALKVYDESKLDIVDCILLSKSLSQDEPLKTFDKKLMRKRSQVKL